MLMLFLMLPFLAYVIIVGSVHFAGTKAFEFSEDKDLQLEEANNPDPKSEDKNVDIPLGPSFSGEPKILDYIDKPKQLQTNSNSEISSDQKMSEGTMMGTQVKVEKLDQWENSSKFDLTSRCAVTNITTLCVDEVPIPLMFI